MKKQLSSFEKFQVNKLTKKEAVAVNGGILELWHLYCHDWKIC